MERFFVIDGENTLHDWGCTLTAKSTPEPEPKTHYIALDGASGTLDLSEALTGEIAYNDRTVTASFLCCQGSYRERQELLRHVRQKLHGCKVQLSEPDDLDHYFVGRVNMAVVTNHRAYVEFTLTATCSPWRYANEESRRRVDVSGEVDVVITNGGNKTLCPDILVDGDIALTFAGAAVDLTDGVYKIPAIKLRQGDNVVSLDGTGAVTFVYREAAL